jgi:ferredoxin-NADP reductase
MPVPTYSPQCISKENIAPNVYELQIEKPSGFTFLPGQFVLFRVPHKDDPHDIQPRAYSIASAPHEQHLRFIIKLVPNGRASRWVNEDVHTGSTVHMQGPFGRFTISNDPYPMLFVATGTGVAPFRSQILWLLKEKNDARPITLIIGTTSKLQFFWEEEWKDLEKKYPHFHVSASFLDGTENWHQEKGSVQEHVKRISTLWSTEKSVYICGAPDIVESVKQQCTMQYNIPARQVHTERYI